MMKNFVKLGATVLLSFLTEKVSAQVVPYFVEDALQNELLSHQNSLELQSMHPESKLATDGTKILELIQKAKD